MVERGSEVAGLRGVDVPTDPEVAGYEKRHDADRQESPRDDAIPQNGSSSQRNSRWLILVQFHATGACMILFFPLLVIVFS